MTAQTPDITGADVPSDPVRAQAAGWTSAMVRTVVILIVCVLAMLPGFAELPVTDRDEARFAQASRQMVETGDLVDIRLQDEARHKKPIGIYWLQTAAVNTVSALTGDAQPGIWAHRLPSLLGAMIAAVVAGWVASMLFGGTVGLAAGVMLAACLGLGVEARLAKTDAALLAAIVTAQAVLARAYLAGHGHAAPLGRGLALLFWGAVGVGILIKGPILPMVTALTVVALVVADRRAGWLLSLRPVVGAPLALLIVLPWLVAITLVSDGAFFEESVGRDLFGKVLGEQAPHVFWPGYYVLTHQAMFWPFAALTLLAAPWAWSRRSDPAVRLCLAWIVPTWIVFEAIPVKLPHYVLPTLPAVAALGAAALFAGYGRSDGRPGGRLMAVVAALALLITATLGGAFALAPVVAFARFGLDVETVSLALWLPIVGAMALGLWLVWRSRPASAIAAMTLSGLLLYVSAYQRAIPAADPFWVSRGAAVAAAAARPCAETVVASAGYREMSLVFMLGTQTRLFGRGGQAADHLVAQGRCGLVLVEERQLDSFQARLSELGASAFGQSIVHGFNYNSGRDVALHVFTLDPG